MTKSGTLIITSIERLAHSRDGGLRFRLHIDTGKRYQTILLTVTDAAVNYDIQNREWLNLPVTLDLNGRGQVYGIEHAPPNPRPPADAAGRPERPDDEIDLTSYRVRTANAIAGTL